MPQSTNRSGVVDPDRNRINELPRELIDRILVMHGMLVEQDPGDPYAGRIDPLSEAQPQNYANLLTIVNEIIDELKPYSGEEYVAEAVEIVDKLLDLRIVLRDPIIDSNHFTPITEELDRLSSPENLDKTKKSCFEVERKKFRTEVEALHAIQKLLNTSSLDKTISKIKNLVESSVVEQVDELPQLPPPEPQENTRHAVENLIQDISTLPQLELPTEVQEVLHPNKQASILAFNQTLQLAVSNIRQRAEQELNKLPTSPSNSQTSSVEEVPPHQVTTPSEQPKPPSPDAQVLRARLERKLDDILAGKIVPPRYSDRVKDPGKGRKLNPLEFLQNRSNPWQEMLACFNSALEGRDILHQYHLERENADPQLMKNLRHHCSRNEEKAAEFYVKRKRDKTKLGLNELQVKTGGTKETKKMLNSLYYWNVTKKKKHDAWLVKSVQETITNFETHERTSCVSHERVMSWLNSLGTESPIPRPTPS
jgi:hypothetical protein